MKYCKGEKQNKGWCANWLKRPDCNSGVGHHAVEVQVLPNPPCFNLRARMSEQKRIEFIEQTYGKTAALDFCKRTMRGYRKAVLHSAKRGFTKPHYASLREWRPLFIRSYLEFKRYVFNWSGGT